MSNPDGGSVRIAGVQCDVQLGDVESNLTTLQRWSRRAKDAGASVVVFPECAATGYCFESRNEAQTVAESASGRFCEAVQQLAAELELTIVYGYLEANGDNLHNSVNLVGPDGTLVGTYRKTHLPCLGVDQFTDPGEEPYRVWEVQGLRIGMLICYDSSFPEPNRCLALAGADLIVLPTNWPPGAGHTADCIPNARALENHVYYMAANRVGTERGFEFIGKSKICEPNGGTIVQAAEPAVEEMLVADIEPQLARNKRLVRVPDKHEIHRFDDRRPDLYGVLSQKGE